MIMVMGMFMPVLMLMSVGMSVVMIMTVAGFMMVVMVVAVAVTMVMIIIVIVCMVMPVRVLVGMAVVVREVDIELHTRDGGFFAAQHVQVVPVQLKLLQLALELGCVHAQVNERADEHVAGNAAKNIEIECFHLDSATRALIWLAA